MGAVTGILSSQKDWEIDFVNTFQIFLLTFFSGIFLRFYGTNSGNETLGSIGLLFAILSLTGVVLVEFKGGSIFKNGATLEESAFAFWMPAVVINLSSYLSNTASTSFSAIAPPGEAYAASALAGEPESIQTFTEVFLASQGENLASFGLGILPVLFAVQTFGKNIYSVLIGLTPLGFSFALIHTTKLSLANLNFLVVAFGLMFIWGLYLYGTDLGFDLPLAESVLITVSFFGGIHFGLNSSNTHGLINVFFGSPEGILSIPDPALQILGYLYFGVYGLSFVYASKYSIMKFLEAVT